MKLSKSSGSDPYAYYNQNFNIDKELAQQETESKKETDQILDNLINNPKPIADESPVKVINTPKQEEYPIFAEGNNNRLIAYKNYMIKKNQEIDNNSQSYLAYLTNKRKQENLKLMSQMPNANAQGNINNGVNATEGNINSQTPYMKSYTSQPNINLKQLYDKFTPYRAISRLSDLTNPTYFYRDTYINDLQKKRNYLNYNLEQSENHFRKKKRYSTDTDDLVINPYNQPHSSCISLGASELEHNTILNPVPNFRYNRYLNMSFSG